LVFLLPVTVGSCKSAGLRDAYMARDAAGRIRTTVFRSEGQEMHLCIEFVSGRDDAIVTTEWFLPGDIPHHLNEEYAPGKGEHTLNTQVYLEDSEGSRYLEGPWPKGHWEVDIMIDGEYQETVAFDVSD
jgi:hypothetical protein